MSRMMENLDHLKKEVAVLLHLDSKYELDGIIRERGQSKRKIDVILSVLQ